jgi:hypothetical protein
MPRPLGPSSGEHDTHCIKRPGGAAEPVRTLWRREKPLILARNRRPATQPKPIAIPTAPLTNVRDRISYQNEISAVISTL